MKKRNAFLSIVLASFLPPILIMVLLVSSPDAITRQAPAGEFISASAAPGGWGATNLTTIQTTAGTLIVQGIFSGRRGEPLLVRDSTRNGLEVCLAREVRNCVALSGSYIGYLQPVSLSGFYLSGNTREALQDLALLWFVLGVGWVVFGGIYLFGPVVRND